MIYCKPIDYPPPAFNPGDRVRFISPEDFFEGGSHTVIASSHTHTLLEGFKFATLNWQLRRVSKASSQISGKSRKHGGEESVTINSKKLRTSRTDLEGTRPTDEFPICFFGVGSPQVFQSFEFFPNFQEIVPPGNDKRATEAIPLPPTRGKPHIKMFTDCNKLF
ncbi:hypothetical protein [Allocoleopsis franciscana]|uniref:Uncharacterized protein n=1 Tax=Allocoleopsis franciscana PCC 7113 TaxID=1173027 RepID=K9WRG7_9CYAN|nr:hypothetical protein [Allocoleopsis franciscana]AFZ22381.1 hypothetical protein Mic7113_6824 [Allocoleopsis franciscana PCC 7113]